jgi:voltage-gated potassium channel
VGTEPRTQNRSNAYHIFVLVLTVYALLIMVALLLPLSPPTLELLRTYDNFICFIFLLDFCYTLYRSPHRANYFLKERGWLDLLGSVPSLGFFRFSELLRLARISRLARITRILRGQDQREMVADVLRNRSQYAAFITLLLAMIVLSLASVLVLQFESQNAEANITTGGDALWWAIVTITTVGYGDKYPVTPGGRSVAFFVMFTGVGIIGALASVLSSVLVQSPTSASSDEEPTQGALELELAGIRGELAALRELLAAQR